LLKEGSGEMYCCDKGKKVFSVRIKDINTRLWLAELRVCPEHFDMVCDVLKSCADISAKDADANQKDERLEL
jgi:hypothetical protein